MQRIILFLFPLRGVFFELIVQTQPTQPGDRTTQSFLSILFSRLVVMMMTTTSSWSVDVGWLLDTERKARRKEEDLFLALFDHHPPSFPSSPPPLTNYGRVFAPFFRSVEYCNAVSHTSFLPPSQNIVIVNDVWLNVMALGDTFAIEVRRNTFSLVLGPLPRFKPYLIRSVSVNHRRSFSPRSRFPLIPQKAKRFLLPASSWTAYIRPNERSKYRWADWLLGLWWPVE